MHIKRRGNDLVVDLADQILFESGQPEVNGGGQKVLGQVAPTLAQLKQYSIQVVRGFCVLVTDIPVLEKPFDLQTYMGSAQPVPYEYGCSLLGAPPLPTASAAITA